MDDHCWICGFKLKPEDFEHIVYTTGGIAHEYCVDLFPTDEELCF